MIFLIKAIRAAVIMLSFGAWAVFMLVTSDVPPNITSNEARLLFALFLIIWAATMAETYVSVKSRYRGGYFTLISELAVLGLWAVVYKDRSSAVAVINSVPLCGIGSCAAVIGAEAAIFAVCRRKTQSGGEERRGKK